MRFKTINIFLLLRSSPERIIECDRLELGFIERKSMLVGFHFFDAISDLEKVLFSHLYILAKIVVY